MSTTDSFKVFAVDDDEIIIESIQHTLENECQLTALQSAEACWDLLASERPDLILLDIVLPGMNGFSLCRKIKDTEGWCEIPIIFISGHDSIEERVRGYDAGGEDFIVKPFEPEELQRKIKVAKSLIASQRALSEQAKEAEHLSSLIMASMDETGILLQFMSRLIAMESSAEIAEGLLDLLRRYRLDGVVQTRIGGMAETYSGAGRNVPLETSVIEHVRTQGRIFEFRRRSVHNFERVTLMVNNLPIDDPDYCGRLRDHLSVAAQGVDSRLKALQADTGILTALEGIGATIADLRENQRRNAADSSDLIASLQETLLNSFYKLGLTDNQEKFLQNLIGDFMTRMAELINQGQKTQEALLRLNQKLKQLRQS